VGQTGLDHFHGACYLQPVVVDKCFLSDPCERLQVDGSRTIDQSVELIGKEIQVRLILQHIQVM